MADVLIQKRVANVCDLSKMLGISKSYIHNIISLGGMRRKELPAGFKIGGRWAWRLEDIEAWLEERAATPEEPTRYSVKRSRRLGRPTKAQQVERREGRE